MIVSYFIEEAILREYTIGLPVRYEKGKNL